MKTYGHLENKENNRYFGVFRYIVIKVVVTMLYIMQVLEKTHAVVLAGGTLQPIEELEYRLYPCLKRNQIHFFSCGHIVPPENVLAIAVSHGPTGRSFDFTYQSRALPEMVHTSVFETVAKKKERSIC